MEAGGENHSDDEGKIGADVSGTRRKIRCDQGNARGFATNYMETGRSWRLRRRRYSGARFTLYPRDHYFGGFYERRGGLSLTQAHFARGFTGNDGSDLLAADAEFYLRQQSVDFQINNFPDELIASAGTAENEFAQCDRLLRAADTFPLRARERGDVRRRFLLF